MSGRDPGSPSGRTPQWVHDEEVQRLVGAMQGDSSVAKPRHRFGRGRSTKATVKRRSPARVLLTVCTALAIVGAGVWYVSPDLGEKISTAIVGEQFHEPGSGSILNAGSQWSAGYPPRGIEADKNPLGQPAMPAQSSDSYTFIDDAGAFVAYDPCRPIHYVTRPDNAPPGGQQLIADAVAAASKAAGLVFIDDGETTEGFSEDRSVYQPDRYGEQWAPVLFVWETPKDEPQFAIDETPGVENVAGLGGSQPIVGEAGSRVYVTGTVQLNELVFDNLLTAPNGTALAGGIVQHELGHVLGLGHVQDPTQLMYEHGQQDITSYADGDLTGLAKLGQGKCYANH
ncbi:Matrixin [Arthrobacter alpinus]|uniref:Matrixin n=1 Tax=Arthrobacter alpinus TaxID=656366 RepID=A0A1H5EM17_9MICC|nr:matrixin family metalloprotease [Arthrobacter alpinus]SED92145.1 Matrixin [Arthrobacter alpinus]